MKPEQEGNEPMSKPRVLQMAAPALMAVALIGTPATARSQESRSEVNVCSVATLEHAVVLVNGRRVGETPVRLRLEPDSTYSVTFKKRGYADATTTLRTETESGWMVLDVFSGVLGFAMDYETSNWTFIEMLPDVPVDAVSRAP